MYRPEGWGCPLPPKPRPAIEAVTTAAQGRPCAIIGGVKACSVLTTPATFTASVRSHSSALPVSTVEEGKSTPALAPRYSTGAPLKASSTPSARAAQLARSVTSHAIPATAHSVLTNDLVNEAGHPTRAALERTLAFFSERLLAR